MARGGRVTLDCSLLGENSQKRGTGFVSTGEKKNSPFEGRRECMTDH